MMMNTPAGAGKTRAGDVQLLGHVEHPRGRGENTVRAANQPHLHETPPRARGKHAQKKCAKESKANTPAGAGKTLRAHNKSGSLYEHPRGRGENLLRQLLQRARA